MSTRAFSVASKSELSDFLKTWGESAPPRLERRGKQKELERFIIKRYLLALDSEMEFGFPLAVIERENPDFVIKGSRQCAGVEVTEACDPTEQAKWTQRAKETKGQSGVIRLDEDINAPDRPDLFTDIIQNAIDKKAQKASEKRSVLLLYVNTGLSAYKDNCWVLSALESVTLPKDKFKKVWLLRGDELIEIGKGT